MARILKILGLVFGAFVVLFAALLVGVAVLVDPNDYKDQITAAVDDATGRTLTLEGDLELHVFPRIGILLGAAELSNAAGFGNAPFARIEGAELRLGLLPLLTRHIEIDSASLTGLRLNLARNASGTTNWDDLARAGDNAAAAATPAPASEGSGDINISVDSIAIADAEVTWADAQSGQDWRLSNFNLQASGFDPGRAFPLAIGFELTGGDMKVTVDSSMRAAVSLAEKTYRLDDLEVELNGEGGAWPGGSGEIDMSFDSFVANLETQGLTLAGLDFQGLGIEVSGDLVGTNVMDNLGLEGRIEIGDFDPRYLMSVFDQSIETADPGVLKRASASAEFYYGSTAMGMRDMSLRLDDSTLTGSAGLRNDRFEFNLTVDAIDIDRYLPPASDDANAAPNDEGSVDEIDLPLDPLRNFSANGNLALTQAQFLGMTFTNANFALAAGNGRMTITPKGNLYGGTMDGEISIQVQGTSGRMGVRANLANVDMSGVGRDYLKIDALEGTGSVNLNLAATGAKVGEIKRGLDGTASVAITDGAWVGIDIWHSIMSARARISGPEVPPLEGEPRTRFSRIAVGGNVENAVLTTNEFAATLPFAALTGSGTVDLLTLELNLKANAGLVDGETLQQDPVLAPYAGRQLPLTISGSVSAPVILPDVRALVSQAVQSRVEEEVDTKVDEARENAEDRLRNRLQDRLRGLTN